VQIYEKEFKLKRISLKKSFFHGKYVSKYSFRVCLYEICGNMNSRVAHLKIVLHLKDAVSSYTFYIS